MGLAANRMELIWLDLSHADAFRFGGVQAPHPALTKCGKGI
jgi:hypothetical protein